MSDKETDNSIWVETMVASKTGEPFVTLRWHDHSAELSPAEARAFAMQVLAGADAAESDAFLYQFFLLKLTSTRDQAGQCVAEFRKYRQEREEKQDGA